MKILCIKKKISYSYLNFSLCHNEICFIINIHPFKCIFDSIIALHEKDDSKTAYKFGDKEEISSLESENIQYNEKKRILEKKNNWSKCNFTIDCVSHLLQEFPQQRLNAY